MIVVIGKSGQLAKSLMKIASQQSHLKLVALGRDDIDVFSEEACLRTLSTLHPSAVINASAYTAVDKAESEQDLAFALNDAAVDNINKACKSLHCHFVHVSTDYVFAGNKGSPYLPHDLHDAQGVYGASKAAGERKIAISLTTRACILRTGWVYSEFGNNFVKTMIKLMQSKPELGVIDDQIGTPTSAATLANACLLAAEHKLLGIHHISDEGIASWYDFAVSIQNLAFSKSLLECVIPIKPISTEQYPTPAKRPAYSVLSKQSLKTALPTLRLSHWQVELNKVVTILANAEGK